MEKYAWTAKIVEGKKDEYIRRHDEIWADLVAVLKDSGIKNYSIWCVDHTLFGYYECEKGAAFAAKTQAESAVVARWNDFMKDVLIMEMDPATGAQPLLTQVFDLP